MIKLRTLGESVIEIGAARLAPDADVLFAALVYLAAERGRQHGRDSLAELFWPTVAHDRARHCLRQTVYRLRQIGVDLWTSPSHVELVAAQVVPTFAAELGRAQLEAERADGVLRLGGFLPGYAPAVSERFAEWLDGQRAHVHSQVRRALLASLEDRRARGEWAEVESLARDCLAFDPLNEEATLALAESAALSGGKAEAIAILDEYIEELGPLAGDIRVPASVLRRRISERFPVRRYQAPADRCFVGRAPEMAILSTALQRARNAEGSATLLWGPPGIGKTRLASEVRKVATLQGVRIVRVGCEESTAERPMGVWVDAVPQLLALPGALGCAPESLAYLRRLTEHDASRPSSSAEVISADVLTASIRRAIVDLVDAVCGEHPLQLLVEDVHWIDASSWNVLHELIEWGTTKRIQLLFTSRTPHALATPPSRLVPSLRLLEVPPLSTKAGETLVRAAAEEDPSRELTPAVLDWCLGVGEGNPFFLRELAGYWVQTGKTHEVPPSLQVLIDARINSLRPASLFVLQACAVLGRNATLERLEALLGLKAYEILTSLDELASAYLTSPGGHGTDLLHDLVASRTLHLVHEPALLFLHRSIARLLEKQLPTANDSTVVWECARHWRMAGEHDRATRSVISYARQLIGIGAGPDAVDLLRTASDEAVDDGDRLAFREELSPALRSCGKWAQVRENVAAIVAQKSRLRGYRHETPQEVLRRVEASFLVRAPMPELLSEATSRAFDPSWDASERMHAATWALILADNCCEAQAAKQVYAGTIALARLFARDDVDVIRRRMIYHASVGSMGRALEAATELDAIARGTSQPDIKAWLLRQSAQVYRFGGLVSDAEANLEHAIYIGRSHWLPSVVASAAEQMANLQIAMGKYDLAAAWLRIAKERLTEIESESLALSIQESETRIALHRGDYAAAEKCFGFALEDIFALPSVRLRASFLATYASVRLHADCGPLPARVTEALAEINVARAHFAGHDGFIATLIGALERQGDRRRAATIAREYTRYQRRESSPVPPYILSAASDATVNENNFR